MRTIGKPARSHVLSHVSEREHGIALVVALAYLVLAAADGGFSAEVRAIAAIVLWWTVVIALLLGLWPRAPIPRTALTAGLSLLGLAALAALSMAWGKDDGQTFVEIVRVLAYLGLFVAVVLASASGRARPWLVGLALGLAAVAVLALGSRLEPGIFPDDTIGEALPAARARLSAPLGYWNGVGTGMATAIVLFAWLGSRGRERWSRALATGAIPMAGLALIMTLSRGAVAALAVGLVALVIVGPQRLRLVGGLAIAGAGFALLVLGALASDDLLNGALGTPAATAQGHRLFALTLVIVAAVALVRGAADARLESARWPGPSQRAVVLGASALVVAAIVAVAVAGRPAERLAEFADPGGDAPAAAEASRLASGSGTGRYQFWSAALDAFASQPMVGIGAGGYETWWNVHGSLPLFIRDAHSLPLETLAELGIVGLVLVSAFLLTAAVTAARGRGWHRDDGSRGAAISVLAVGAVAASVDWAWELPAVFAPTVVVVALLTGPALGRPASSEEPRFGIGVATLLVAWIAILAAGVSFATEYTLDQSRSAATRGDLPAAAGDAQRAAVLQPWAAEPRFQLARIERTQGDLAAAEQSVSETIERSPDDWRAWLFAFTIRAERGNVDGGRAAFAKSETLRPQARPVPEPVP